MTCIMLDILITLVLKITRASSTVSGSEDQTARHQHTSWQHQAVQRFQAVRIPHLHECIDYIREYLKVQSFMKSLMKLKENGPRATFLHQLSN